MEYIFFTPLHVNVLTIDALFSLNKSTIELSRPIVAEIGLVAAAALALLEELQQEMGAGMNRSQKSTLSGLVKTVDKERDELVKEIFNVTALYSKSSNESKKIAASNLQIFLTPYKGVAFQPLNFETGTLADLIQKYKANPVLTEAAEMLDIADIFPKLEEKNNEFNEVYHSRNAEYAGRETAAYESKPAVAAAYMHFATAVEQAHNFIPNGALASLFKQMDVLRKSYHSLDHNSTGKAGS
jgi:hypothetical protein